MGGGEEVEDEGVIGLSSREGKAGSIKLSSAPKKKQIRIKFVNIKFFSIQR